MTSKIHKTMSDSSLDARLASAYSLWILAMEGYPYPENLRKRLAEIVNMVRHTYGNYAAKRFLRGIKETYPNHEESR